MFWYELKIDCYYIQPHQGGILQDSEKKSSWWVELWVERETAKLRIYMDTMPAHHAESEPTSFSLLLTHHRKNWRREGKAAGEGPMGSWATGSVWTVCCAFWTFLGLVTYTPGVGKPQPMGQIQPTTCFVACLLCKLRMVFTFFFFFFFNFYWGIVDLQCCVSYRCTAKWIRYTYTVLT